MLKATLRSIAGHRARLAMTGLAVVLGVALMSGTLVLTDTVGRTFDQLFANAYAGTDAVVRSTDVVESQFGPEQRAPVAASVLEVVNGTPGVAIAEPSVTGFAQLVAPNGEAVGNPQGGAPSFGFNWSQFEQLNPFRLVEGVAPSTANDVVIDKGSATDANIAVGDTVTVLTANAPRQFTVSGIAAFGEIDSPAGATVSMFTLPVTQELFGTPDTYSEIAVVATDGTSQQQLVDNLDAVLPAGAEALTGADRTAEDQSAIAEALGFFNTFLLAFAVVALVVGAFIIYNTFSIVLAQRTRELALLRAIGASRRQVLTSVLSEAVIVGVLASLVGMVLGIATSIGLRSLLGATGFDIPSTSIVVSSTTVAIAVGTGTAITLVAAVFPALRAARIPPIAALRDVAVESSRTPVLRIVVGIIVLGAGVANIANGLSRGGDNALAAVAVGALLVFLGVAVLGPAFARPVSRAISWPLPRLFGVTGTLARENASRNPRRTATTAAALMIGVALVGFIAIFASSATASINKIIDESFTGDLIIDSGQFFVGGVSPDLAAEVAEVPGVAASTGVRFADASIDGSASTVFAVDTAVLADITDPKVVDGRVSNLAVDEMAVAAEVASTSNISVGDTVTARFATGERTLTVVGTYDNRALLGDRLVDLTTIEQGTTDPLDLQIWVKVDPDADVATVQQQLIDVAAPWPTAEVQDLTEFKDAQVAQFNQLLTLVYALLGLAVIIALVGIANTLALSVFERTRELGLMRAVGMSRSQLRSVVRWESVIIAVFGTLLGLIIGIGFGWAMVQALSSQGLGVLRIPVGTLVGAVVVAALAGVVAALLPARRAARLDVLAAVSSE